MVPTLDAARRWECPSCARRIETTEPATKIPLHPCPALGGLQVPFAPVLGDELDRRQVRHVPIERGDYLGDENVSPIMAVHTERADGSHDTHVYAPIATARQE
jgi:hypothetical protein